ncbi:WD repeat-containing protein [Ceratobasidium sp. AG-Ba]|nr:WD repeat-containing protein [Ceratobasidium sp. AG-Ba]
MEESLRRHLGRAKVRLSRSFGGGTPELESAETLLNQHDRLPDKTTQSTLKPERGSTPVQPPNLGESSSAAVSLYCDEPPPYEPRTTSRCWLGLNILMSALEASADSFGPFKAAIRDLYQCAETFDRIAETQKEYAELRLELNQISEDISRYISDSIPPSMASSVTSLACGISREVEMIQRETRKSGIKRYLDAANDTDQIIQSYRRIQALLSRVGLNVNMNLWKIMDEQKMDKKLKALPHSPAAIYCSIESGSLHRNGCTPSTRVDVLQELRDWVIDPKSQKIYWLNGMAGTGKTTIAYSLCEYLENTGMLAANFFCSRQLPACRDVNRIMPSIAHQLSLFSRPFRFALSSVLDENPEAHNQILARQFEKLVVLPVEKAQHTLPTSLVVVIDALDECEDSDGVDRMLDALLTHASRLPMKFVMTSRPDPIILDRMRSKQGAQLRKELRLHELNHSVVRQDIKTYLTVELEPAKLTVSDLENIVNRSGVLFIYAATVARYIGYDNFSRSATRLKQILAASVTSTSNGHKEMDNLYNTIIKAALDDNALDESEKDEMKLVLHTVVCAQEPLTISALAGLLKIPHVTSVRAALRPLFSVLQVADEQETVTTLHESFPNYILDRDRSHDFHCDSGFHNELLVRLCFEQIAKPSPSFNICSLPSSYYQDSETPDVMERIQKYISTELLYACRYWIGHMIGASSPSKLEISLSNFLSTKLLLWMEILNLNDHIHEGSAGLYNIYVWIKAHLYSESLQKLAEDSWRFVTAFASTPMIACTPHIYLSALAFWPENRPVSKCYIPNMRGLVKGIGTAMKRRELAPLVICGVRGAVSCIAYSPNGLQIVSGCLGGDLYLWDPHTGRPVGQPLQKHSDSARSCSYSPDGDFIASGSLDGTVVLWDAHTGKLIKILSSDRRTGISCVAWSPCGKYLISGFLDGRISIWDSPLGVAIEKPLLGHKSMVSSVAYSPDGAYIASGSHDCTVCIWSSHTGLMLGQPLQGHSDWVNSIAYSRDGQVLASCSHDRTIRLWDAKQQQVIGRPLCGHMLPVYCVAFSHDGKYLISGSADTTIRLWATDSGCAIGEPLENHTDWVTSVTYSPDGAYIASGSRDSTVRIWDSLIGTSSSQDPHGHTGAIYSVAYSPNGECFVSGSQDMSVQVWDTITGDQAGAPLVGHKGSVRSVAYSPDGVYIASGSQDCTVRIWLARTGQMVGQPLQGHTDWVNSVAYSPDGKHVVSGSDDCTILVWATDSRKVIAGPLKEYSLSKHRDWVNSIAYSPDGSRLVSGSDDCTICIWDTSAGLLVGTPLRGHSGRINSVAYLSQGRFIVSSSEDCNIRIWDAQTGHAISEPYRGHMGSVYSIACSPRDSHCISGSADRTIRIWELDSTGSAHWLLQQHGPPVTSLSFSPDGQDIAVASSNSLISIWNVFTGQSSATLIGHRKTVTSVAYSPCGTRIASASGDQTIIVWDIQTAQSVMEPLVGHASTVNAVAYSPNASLIVSGCSDGHILIWDAHTGRMEWRGSITRQEGEITSIAYSANNSYIVSGSSAGVIHVWNTNAEVLNRITGEDVCAITSVAFSPDNVHIVSGDRLGRCRVWNLDNSRQEISTMSHRHSINSVMYSPDGMHITSSSDDGALYLWNVRNRHRKALMPGNQVVAASSMAYSPLGTHVAVGGHDGLIILVKLTSETLTKLEEGGSSVDIFTKWTISGSGWVSYDGRRLFWVPGDVRGVLLRSANRAVISKNGSLKLDFSEALVGEDWVKCYNPKL